MIDATLAKEQQNALIAAVRRLGVDVLELPPDEAAADSVFTQDLAVVVNGIALMCRPGPSRQAEVRTRNNTMPSKNIRSVKSSP